MAFEFDPDKMFKMCAMYISKGIPLVRINGIYPDGRCTCGNPDHRVGGPGERSCGKHPVGTDWASAVATTEDEILEWLDDGVPFNVGILCGPEGGFIDCEDDGPEGKAYRQLIGMDGLLTPTWSSGKSTHQMLYYHKKLDGAGGVKKPGGLEVRIGADGSSIQSVMPPSWHYTGVQYQWKPGLSPDEVEVADIPKQLLVAIVNGAERGLSRAAPTEPPATSMIFGEVKDGSRHRAILRWTWFKLMNTKDPLRPVMQDLITRETLILNEKNCKPPGDEKKVRKIIADCFEYYRRKLDEGWKPTDSDESEEAAVKAADEIAVQGKSGQKTSSVQSCGGFEVHGLQRVTIGQIETYAPGNWSIQLIRSDPPEIILCVPAWESTPCRGRIPMSLDTFRSATKVASAVFTATLKVILDTDSKKWMAIWKGVDASKKTGGQSIPGLMAQLMQAKNDEDDIYVGTSSLRYAQLAGYVLQVFKRATKPKDEEKPEPNESGRPCWMAPDQLWLQWGKIWDDIGRTHDVMAGERNRVRAYLVRSLGVKDFVHKRHLFASGRLEYVVFDRKWIAALETLASGRIDESDGNPPPEGGVPAIAYQSAPDFLDDDQDKTSEDGQFGEDDDDAEAA